MILINYWWADQYSCNFFIIFCHQKFLRLSRDRSAGAAIGFMPDDSTGSKEVFRVEDMTLVPVGEEMHGMFFGGDSYVIKYEYEKDGRPGYIVYFWQVERERFDDTIFILQSSYSNPLNVSICFIRVPRAPRTRLPALPFLPCRWMTSWEERPCRYEFKGTLI